MKIAIAYPPLESEKGVPLLGQNRQFQWAHDPWTAYPMVPAYAATMLKNAGYKVIWLDGIAGEQTYSEWLSDVKKEKPDLLMIETKTPVIKRHWKIISDIKKLETGNWKLDICLVGDHVTALPEESFKNSKVDYILTGGDYDFLLLNLANYLSKGEKLESGIWYRTEIRNTKYEIRNTGKFKLNHDLNSLPMIDRELTKWQLYAYKNSNYLQKPGTYTMFGRDCWWGKCVFCSWTTLYPGAQFRVMSPKRALDEVGYILQHTCVREIMDDSGTFPVGDWLREFCKGMIKRGYNQKIKIDCNMRFNSDLTQKDYDLMAKAGFRFLLYGLESANQKTLDRLNKNLRVEQITTGVRMAKKAGLCPHATVMVGYPWETKEDAIQTLELAKKFFCEGLIDSLQATVVIPYPGTPLFKECEENDWLKTKDWDRYDMKEPVMKTVMSNEEILGMVRSIYSAIWSPQFVVRKLKEGLTDWNTFKYYTALGWKFISKRIDFKKTGIN
ncbi:B12-binding domain-containing radical SAM protein [Candidatus Shapirobacteria bacterium CG08_land_8_20_14_0_20_39_18]|uniref:B12-binding domain-containing radical SAM protein n=1 Tax=Candidatus Shapirobacteria bacterium CG08_land_8_20_14_0_20_39_18 TaxID=1974883 RepID=A0A2M6XDS9_9BACT|nr:MAG: B12-binding domain-containing radical SAM protein [Candidatus Shapirobacteria bacterium CG08_land_8_20_14_0_20_39_18]